MQCESQELKKNEGLLKLMNQMKNRTVEEVTGPADPITQHWEQYLIFLVIGKAGSPVHTSDVSSCHFDNIQFERLLYEDNVIFRDSKAMVVAWVEQGARRDGAYHFQMFKTRFLLFFF